VAYVLGHPCGTPPLHACDIEIRQCHHVTGRGWGPRWLGPRRRRRLGSCLGSRPPRRSVQIGVDDCKMKSVVVQADCEYRSLAIDVEE
jgi:hypothetical protein